MSAVETRVYNSGRDTAAPYENFCLYVLADAAKGKNCKMWQDFKKAFALKNPHQDVLTVASWVAGWLVENHLPKKANRSN